MVQGLRGNGLGSGVAAVSWECTMAAKGESCMSMRLSRGTEKSCQTFQADSDLVDLRRVGRSEWRLAQTSFTLAAGADLKIPACTRVERQQLFVFHFLYR